jgi:site-specific DNA-cytosine methylase
MLRELRPAFAVFENVPGLVISEGGRFFNRVFSEIHESGYDAEWAHIPATAVGAWHLRNRVWIICYEQGGPPLADAESEQRQRGGNARHQPGPSNGGVASGERIMAYAEYKGIHKQGLTANAGAENGKSGRV